MEPLNDDELKHVASSWQAPAAPEYLHSRVFGAHRPWWRWLFTGAIRVPVPVCAAVVLVLVWLTSGRLAPEVDSPSSDRQTVVTLADFEAPAEVQVRVVGAPR
jgi:hypothetical protein